MTCAALCTSLAQYSMMEADEPAFAIVVLTGCIAVAKKLPEFTGVHYDQTFNGSA